MDYQMDYFEYLREQSANIQLALHQSTNLLSDLRAIVGEYSCGYEPLLRVNHRVWSGLVSSWSNVELQLEAIEKQKQLAIPAAGFFGSIQAQIATYLFNLDKNVSDRARLQNTLIIYDAVRDRGSDDSAIYSCLARQLA